MGYMKCAGYTGFCPLIIYIGRWFSEHLDKW